MCCFSCIQEIYTSIIFYITFALVYLVNAFCCCCCYPCSTAARESRKAKLSSLYVFTQTLETLRYFPFVSWHYKIKKQFVDLLALPPVAIFDSNANVVPFERYNELAEFEPAGFPANDVNVRSVDGFGNNLKYPWLGQGNRGYGFHLMQRNEANDDGYLTSPEAVVADLCSRKVFEPAENGANALGVYFAFLVIHEFFRSDVGKSRTTASDRPHINLHSSYLDLQTLYGFNKDSAKAMRTFQDGKIKPDMFADNRLKVFAVTKSILLLFNKEHNKICDMLLQKYPKRFEGDDEALYQQARLINCGVFVTCIQREYTCLVTGVVPSKGRPGVFLQSTRGTQWKNPEGFHTTIEFQFLYRFHATIPEVFDPRKFNPSEPFNPEEVLLEAISNPSGRFGSKHIPDFVVPSEAKVVEFVRKWRFITFNQFRQDLNLKKKGFKDFSKNPEIEEILRKHFKTADDIDFYSGFLAEDAGIAGWGLSETCFTGIIADASACISNDRFYTTDFTEKVYTKWGLKYCQERTTVDMINEFTSLKFDKKTTNLTKLATVNKKLSVVPMNNLV